MSYGFKKFKTALKATFMGNQFSDATNTKRPFTDIFGPVPSCSIVDLSANYQFSKTVSSVGSIHNLLNNIFYPKGNRIPTTRNYTCSDKYRDHFIKGEGLI